MRGKLNLDRFLPFLAGVLSFAGMILSQVSDAKNEEKLKTEIKQELMEEMSR